MSRLSLVNLSKHFGKVVAVDEVTVAVDDGEFLCILGPSGCGKSTILRIIAGLEEPTAGDIQLDNDSITHLPANRRPTAMVFQKYTLWPHMKVYDNIAFGLQLRKLPRQEIRTKVEKGLELVGLSGYEARYPAQLSGGQQQRVALARALVLEPKILLLDEPFSSLDALLRVRLREELRRIQRTLNITTIFVTHDQEEALTLADRIAVMNIGKIEQVGKPSAIYAQPQTLFAADFIGAMNLLTARLQNHQLHIGSQTLIAPTDMPDAEMVSVAIRPEDFAIWAPGSEADSPVKTWTARVEYLMDLGHYRKALIHLSDIGDCKIYLPKSALISEGDTIQIYPVRYVVYRDGQPPIEVNRELR